MSSEEVHSVKSDNLGGQVRGLPRLIHLLETPSLHCEMVLHRVRKSFPDDKGISSILILIILTFKNIIV